MAIFLGVLKIVGIVLLCIIGLILALVLWFIFWPYEYFVKASKDQDINALARVSFFFRFISVNVIYDDGINIRLKILGIPIYDKKRKDAKLNKNKKHMEFDQSENIKANKKATKDGFDDFDDFEMIKDSKKAESLKKTENATDVIEDKSVIKDKENISIDEHNAGDELKAAAIDDKEGFFSRLWSKPTRLYEKVYGFFAKIPDKLESVINNIETSFDKLVDSYDYYVNLLNKKGSIYVIDLVKKKVIKILRSIRPRKCKALVMYGSTDPEKSAKVIELYSMLLLWLPKNAVLIPDFEDDYLKFDISVKGRVCIGYILIMGLSLVLNKRFRIFIKLLKREEIRDGRK